jgi:hypothetical protein
VLFHHKAHCYYFKNELYQENHDADQVYRFVEGIGLTQSEVHPVCVVLSSLEYGLHDDNQKDEVFKPSPFDKPDNTASEAPAVVKDVEALLVKVEGLIVALENSPILG